MKRPNFFIVGGPKCGTTAMHAYLRMHPNIFMPSHKETNFFVDHLPDDRRVQPLDVYLDLFQQAGEEHLVVGEASVFYLVSPVAIRRIHDFDRDARLVAMLRNPLDMAHSFHAQIVFNGEEDVTDFATAWDMQSDRAKGIGLPAHCHDPLRFQYASMCMLGEQVERMLDIFPRDQVKLIVFDDFKRSTEMVYEDLLAFLDVPSDGRTEFPRINENTVIRSDRVARLLNNLPQPVERARQSVKSALGIRHTWLGHALRRLNTRNEKRSPMRVEVRQKMIATFRDDVEKLGDILNRDLSHWMAESAHPSGVA